jgi:hypothetical protein
LKCDFFQWKAAQESAGIYVPDEGYSTSSGGISYLSDEDDDEDGDEDGEDGDGKEGLSKKIGAREGTERWFLSKKKKKNKDFLTKITKIKKFKKVKKTITTTTTTSTCSPRQSPSSPHPRWKLVMGRTKSMNDFKPMNCLMLIGDDNGFLLLKKTLKFPQKITKNPPKIPLKMQPTIPLKMQPKIPNNHPKIATTPLSLAICSSK